MFGCVALCGWAGAQTATLQLPQNAMLVDTNYALGINWQSYGGVPISSVVGHGSDGRYHLATGPSIYPATTSQFNGFVGVSAVPVQSATNLIPNQSFAANAVALGWPNVQDSSGHVALILRSAQVGAPYLGQAVSFLFGSVIPVPSTDENAAPLPQGTSASYWFPTPYTTNNFTNAPYYWSPNAQAVFATQPGVINITWKKAVPSTTVPPDYAANPSSYSLEAGLYYRLYTASYLVSGSPVQTPQKMLLDGGVVRGYGRSGVGASGSGPRGERDF